LPSPAASATALLTDALASYRLTRLITTDRLTLPLRQRIITAAREDAEKEDDHPSPLLRSAAYLVTCDYCVSIYTSAALSLIHSTPPTSPLGAMLRTARYALATAGAVSAFREVLDR
jgi:Protein of unknown function (DUF1360)